ncbi:MAG: sialate O-acetylesterase, partial [Victivallaceae bacterium]|nr:sialate O-acetylesterase [Victivallaceae bacterium]
EFRFTAGAQGPRPPLPEELGGDSMDFPASLFNGMIAPWTRVNMCGVIWYQGCSNAGKPGYFERHVALINAWRNCWRDDRLPFIIVQLAGLGKNSPDAPLDKDFWRNIPPENEPPFAVIREIQSEIASKMPNVGLAVAIDQGEVSDIHPRRKQPVGFRLAKEAERMVYGQNNGAPGPVFRRFTTEGNTVRVEFDNAGSGLATSDGKSPGAFALAGADRVFHWAEAAISLDGKCVTVRSAEVPEPQAVRYAFVSFRGDVNLCNKAGFPACPFRSDKPGFGCSAMSHQLKTETR